ncbi:hypothetical protein Bbelb_389770 [Branchiostoma belcheri]|nr:hypothetical protein Bbelb_389770 [Branchiostoma belcheri]
MAALSNQFLAEDVLFSHGLLDIAEEAYSQILKHALEMDDKPLEVAALKAIGDVYLEKGRLSQDGKDFTKASALYNAALVRCADWDGRQSLVHRIKRTEKCFMRYVAGIRKHVPSTRREDMNRKLQLQKIRNRSKEQLETLSSVTNHSYEGNPMESEETRNTERKRTEAVRSLYSYIAVKMKQFIVGMVEECIETLRPVPCQYAMVGMGSICREEMTPYSDLEFAILVKEGKCTDQTKTYFRTLTHLLHLKVLNLGETILPSMAIKSLNDFNNKETDWYYDDTTPCGFSFDGSMPWASKTALGRDQTSSKPALELIMTPSEMAELQKDERSVKEGYHLADVLCNVTLISGEQTLVEAYRSRVQELLDLPSQINALTPEAHHNFSTIVAIVDELRLHTYVANRAQRGLLGYNVTTVKDSRVYNTFDCKHHVIWRRLLYTLIPLHVCVNKFLAAVDRAVHASAITRLSAALGYYTTAVKYLEEELQLIQPFNNREDEMPPRFLLWKAYSELSMPEEAEKHRLRWIHCLHPLLVEAVLMLQNQTSLDDVQSKTVEERFQKFEESLQVDKSVVPWDVAVYVLNYSKLLENQKRYVDVDRVYHAALNKLQAWNSSSPKFDTKVYPRMIISQAACLFYMRQGNHGRPLDCLHSVLRYSTLLPVDRVACACKDHATMNYVRFCATVLHFQQNIGCIRDVKHTLLANIGEVCSIVSFRATAFGPKVADACADCVYDLGEALENMGETLAAVEMFHVGLKICTSQEFFTKALVFLTAMFRARRIPITHCTCNR